MGEGLLPSVTPPQGAQLMGPYGAVCLAYPGQISLAEGTGSLFVLPSSKQYSSYSCSCDIEMT